MWTMRPHNPRSSFQKNWATQDLLQKAYPCSPFMVCVCRGRGGTVDFIPTFFFLNNLGLPHPKLNNCLVISQLWKEGGSGQSPGGAPSAAVQTAGQPHPGPAEKPRASLGKSQTCAAPTTTTTHLQHLVLGILLKVVESEREFKEVLAEFAFGGRKKQELDQPWWPHPLAPVNPNSEGTAALQRRTSQGTGTSAA